MVVLAASIITKTGKAILSRQFVDMTRMRIEGLLAAFPKLVGIGKQHTYVETDEVRYLYQPMESLYLLLITTKQSNVLEDLETLRLLVKIVQEYCPALDEGTICLAAFAVIFAFDEVVSQGYRESVTVQQVHQFCEMESHEENLHKMIMQTKINDARDVMQRKAQEIDRSKMEKAKYEGSQGSYSSLAAVSGGPVSISNGFEMNGDGTSGGFSNGSAFGSGMDNDPFSKPTAAKVPAPGKGMGMKLGKSHKANKLIESLKAEGEIMESDGAPALPSASALGPAAKTAVRVVPADPIAVVIEEKVSCVLKKEGGLDSLGIMGTMSLEVQKEEDAYIRVQLETGDNKNFKFRPHPNIDKALHAKENTLGLRDPNKPFPTCTAVGILKWMMQTKDESLVPLTVNCWGSISSGDSFVIEYEASKNFELHNVVFTIPLPALRDPPTVNEVDGEWRYDARRSVLEWVVEHIDNTNRNGQLEFVVPATDTAVFFPVDVKFTATKSYCDIKVKSVVTTAGNPVKASVRTSLVVDSYQVV